MPPAAAGTSPANSHPLAIFRPVAESAAKHAMRAVGARTAISGTSATRIISEALEPPHIGAAAPLPFGGRVAADDDDDEAVRFAPKKGDEGWGGARTFAEEISK